MLLFKKRIRVLALRLIHAHLGPTAAQALLLARRLKMPSMIAFVTLYSEHVRSYTFLRNCHSVAKRAQTAQASALFTAGLERSRRPLFSRRLLADKRVTPYSGIDSSVFVGSGVQAHSQLVLSSPQTVSVTESVSVKATRTLAVVNQPAPESSVIVVGNHFAKMGGGHLLPTMPSVQRPIQAAKLVVIGAGPLEEWTAQQGMNALFVRRQTAEHVRDWMTVYVPSIMAENRGAHGLLRQCSGGLAVDPSTVTTGSVSNFSAVNHSKTGGWVVPGADEGQSVHAALLWLKYPDLIHQALTTALGDGRTRLDLPLLVEDSGALHEQVIFTGSAYLQYGHLSGEGST
ncbi:hypothetical protein [Deinococcus sp. QL22]|uniref:hypothetical protein n=1 Tax=Deinococcus sp. QL22 TaxID=2939437 RepID=UPI002016C123|nr:hypothetical protein [Deinococcus sp. QL22]UQN09696.1 hypothetical protein M1R55_24810 [Deinococcus sp. QL22]